MVGREDWLKEGEGISVRTYMQDPWTWTTVWGLPKGVGVVRGKNWDNCNSINNKIFLKNESHSYSTIQNANIFGTFSLSKSPMNYIAFLPLSKRDISFLSLLIIKGKKNTY